MSYILITRAVKTTGCSKVFKLYKVLDVVIIYIHVKGMIYLNLKLLLMTIFKLITITV